MPGNTKYYFTLLAILSCLFLRAQYSAYDTLPVPISSPLITKPQLLQKDPGLPNSESTPDPRNVNTTPFIIRSIEITGNRKTRSSIILREIPFKTGDQYSLTDLVEKFEEGKRQLLNTSLFHEVVIALKNAEGQEVDLLISVKERWYLFPLPYFRPVDRNLNQWLFENHGSLDRVNYGAKLLYSNVTGRNDKLRLWILNGYTKQLSFNYDRIYIDKKLRWGMNVGFAVGKNHEVNYNTIDDKQVFLKDEGYIRSFLNATAELTWRPAIKTKHKLGIGYTVDNVKDTVVTLNPGYFKPGQSSVRFVEVYYNLAYYDLDYIPYPTKGYATEITIAKRGFNSMLSTWQLSVKALASWPVLPKTFISLRGYGVIKLPFRQPYFNQRLLGYSDAFLQGYEYYVVDGVAGGFLKASVTRELFEFRIRVPQKNDKGLSHIPFRVLGKIYGNSGYVHNPQPGANSLSNTMLWSGGIGIDILSVYDFTLKLEWTFNQLGENGLFLHRKSIF
jgi:outer membrane protein assembly factor BamA